MEFLKVVGDRRSVRWFKTWKPVPADKVQRILEVARRCTSPGNIQPWRAVVVERDTLDDRVRDELLAADNWQGAHTQAPTWIYWFADTSAATGEGFARTAIPLIELGAAPRAYGWDEKRMQAAIRQGEEMPEGTAAVHELLHSLPAELSAGVAVAETVGACAFATLAAVNEGLGTCLHMAAKPSSQARLKELLKVPEEWAQVWVQLVGYPAEEPDAGGQRPRRPFEEMFFVGDATTPFPRNERVVSDLEAEELIQPEMPLPGRYDELRFLARMYGYPELDVEP